MKNKPVIVCAALLKEGIIIAGPRHYDLVMKTQIMPITHCEKRKRKINFNNAEQGFVDQFGKFYNREEALKVAKDAGQDIDFERNGSTTELYSEGLY